MFGSNFRVFSGANFGFVYVLIICISMIDRMFVVCFFLNVKIFELSKFVLEINNFIHRTVFEILSTTDPSQVLHYQN